MLQQTQNTATIPIGDVRQVLYKYTKKRLFVPGRTPKAGEAFSDKWNHLADVAIQKAIKDMTIRDHIKVIGGGVDSQTIDLDGVKSLFFDPYEAPKGT